MRIATHLTLKMQVGCSRGAVVTVILVVLVVIVGSGGSGDYLILCGRNTYCICTVPLSFFSPVVLLLFLAINAFAKRSFCVVD